MKRLMLILMLSGVFVFQGQYDVTAEPQNDVNDKQRIEQKIDRLNKRIEELQTEADAIEDEQSRREWNDNLEKARSALQEQWNNIKGASASAWDSMEEGTQNLIDETQETYREAKRSFKEWRLQQEFEDFRERQRDLAESAKDFGEDVSAAFQANQRTYNTKIDSAENKIESLKEASADKWQAAWLEAQESMDEVELTLTYLERKVYRWNVEERIEGFEDKLDDLKVSSEDIDEEVRDKFHSAMGRFEGSLEDAQDKVSEWASEGEEEWNDFRKQMDKAIQEVKKSYQKAKRFITTS